MARAGICNRAQHRHARSSSAPQDRRGAGRAAPPGDRLGLWVQVRGRVDRSGDRVCTWRIVLGFAACIAGVLAVQAAAVLVWLKSVPDDQHLRDYTHAVAADLAGALAEAPDRDMQRYVDLHYPKPLASLDIIFARGLQIVMRGPDRPPDADIAAVRSYWSRHPTTVPDNWMTGPYLVAPITVNGQLMGEVGIVVPRSWRELLSGKMALLSLVLLFAGTGLGGWFIVGSLRRRFSNSRAPPTGAARATSARAPASRSTMN